MIPERKCDMKNKEILIEAVAKRLGVDKDEVRITEILKNNGVKRTSVNVNRKAGNQTVSANVYIDDIIGRLDDDSDSVGRAATEIAIRYREASENEGMIDDLSKIDINREFVLENASIQVVGTESNADLLEDTPHRIIADLAAVVRVIVKTGKHGPCGSILVKKSMIDSMGISEDELFENAMRNMVNRSAFRCMSMAQMMAELSGREPDELDTPGGLYILTNESKFNGAAVLAFPDEMARLIDKICPDEESVYVIPSSIHEVLILAGCGLDANDLRYMVREINSTQVQPDEVLSNNVYVFDKETKELRVA